MRKSVVVVALLALPLLSACANSQQAATPTPAGVPTSVAPTSGSGLPTTLPSGLPTLPSGVTLPSSIAATPGALGALTAAEISKALQDKGKLNQQTADCVAGIYIQEGLSDSGIQKIIESANGANPTKVNLGTEDLLKAGKAGKRIATECTK
ncbi:hypothetical protein ACFRAQ_22245 [Nocardia sp. NPDC056611]|uniref:hypothetical protein n=1 Tax=Nocardia sp. NPDC056611 TaxID=3345877 RepID=UPI003671648D